MSYMICRPTRRRPPTALMMKALPRGVDMQRKMLKWLEATDDIVPFELDERFTPEMLWARVRGLVPPEKEAEVRKMIADARHSRF